MTIRQQVKKLLKRPAETAAQRGREAFASASLPLSLEKFDEREQRLAFQARDREAFKLAKRLFPGYYLPSLSLQFNFDEDNLQIIVSSNERPLTTTGFPANNLATFVARLKVFGNDLIDLETALDREGPNWKLASSTESIISDAFEMPVPPWQKSQQ